MKTNPSCGNTLHEDHKLAALLFDYVLPMWLSASVPKEVEFKAANIDSHTLILKVEDVLDEAVTITYAQS